MNQYFVYILLLCNDNSYYTGITNDLERRVYEHEMELLQAPILAKGGR